MSTIKELYDYRQMIFSLVKKDLRGRYKGSVLGFLWTFINPLFQLIVYTIVFSKILRNDVPRYYLYLFVALIPWIFFSSSITVGAASIISQKDLVKKIYFPRMVIPISYVTSCFVNMLLCFIVIFAVIIVTGAGINFVAVLTLPIIMIVEYIFALGMAMLSSAVTVYFRDLEHILGIVSMAWMYLTPIVYSKSIVPEKYLPIFNLNPMTPIIECYRTVLYDKQIPDLSTLLIAAALGVFFLIFGALVFNKLQKHFAEEL
ncbi:ABC transporter permease [Ruminococcus flavefaciens]|uniref:Transport permease protein n=1 Tax=Ruminococcus flavefaciens TaxID=1265 RepID=A0A1H6JAB2_RUMFL|nr:ABC transporter permease [Ruminococcus flavefaciens]SEH56594.1 ABC-2 type transport system permease protein [Ruminococcus flavefaciens]